METNKVEVSIKDLGIEEEDINLIRAISLLQTSWYEKIKAQTNRFVGLAEGGQKFIYNPLNKSKELVGDFKNSIEDLLCAILNTYKDIDYHLETGEGIFIFNKNDLNGRCIESCYRSISVRL